MNECTQFERPIVYAVKHKNDEERLSSQSGGMFAALSDIVLKKGGVIYGCVFDENFKAIHIRTDSEEGRNKMRYSKYVQSDMNDCFQQAANDLQNGRLVLFSGTSCQIAAIKSFLKLKKIKYNSDKFYTVDIVCHGVPSPLVWKDYLDWEQSKRKATIKKVICRNKRKFGWKSHVTTITWNKGLPINSRVFPKLFYSHVILRPACYRCPYKSVMHPADITIADYWGIDKALPGFKDDKGVSLVLINNEDGKKLFRLSSENLFYEQTLIEDSLQQPLVSPYDPPDNREEFWKDYSQHDFEYIARKYGDYHFYKVLKWKIRYWIRRNLGI